MGKLKILNSLFGELYVRQVEGSNEGWNSLKVKSEEITNYTPIYLRLRSELCLKRIEGSDIELSYTIVGITVNFNKNCRLRRYENKLFFIV